MRFGRCVENAERETMPYGKKRMPKKAFVWLDNTSPHESDSYLSVSESAADAVQAADAIYVGEYKLVRMLKVSQPPAKVEPT
jgi:hypothetical protein